MKTAKKKVKAKKIVTESIQDPCAVCGQQSVISDGKNQWCYTHGQSPAYSVALQLDKTTLEGKGNTLLEAFKALKPPIKITTKSILTVVKGEKHFSRGLTIPLAKRLFYPAAQIHIAKNYEALLK